jgi:hypothetical protein
VKFRLKVSNKSHSSGDDIRSIRINGQPLGREITSGIRRVFKWGNYVVKLESRYDLDYLSQCSREIRLWNKKIKNSQYKKYFVPTVAFGRFRLYGEPWYYTIQPFVRNTDRCTYKMIDKACHICNSLRINSDDIRHPNVLRTGKNMFKIVDYGV